MALPELGRNAAPPASLALHSTTGTASPHDLPPEAVAVTSPASTKSPRSPRRAPLSSPRGKHVSMDRLLELAQTSSGQSLSPRRANSGYHQTNGLRSQEERESQLIVQHQRPVVYGDFLEVQCVLGGGDIAFILNNADAAVDAVLLDAGQMQAEELSPSSALKCRGVCERFMAGKPKRLRHTKRQKWRFKPKPFRFVAADGAEEACLCLQLVSTASCLGPDMWRQIARPYFFQVVKPREWEMEFLQRVARADAIFRGFSLCLSAMSTAPSKVSALADDINVTLKSVWATLIQSQAGLPYSKAMQEIIRLSLQKFVMEPIQGSYEKTLSGFPIVKDLARSTYSDCLKCLKSGVTKIYKFWTAYFQTVFEALIARIDTTAKWHDSETIKKTLYPMLLGKGSRTEEANKINIDLKAGALKPGDEIKIGDEFHRVQRLGSIETIYDIQEQNENLDVQKLNLALLIPATDASKGKTLNFIEAVELFDTETHETKLQGYLKELGLSPLEGEQRKRKERLIELYTRNELFGRVNRSMYQDNAQELEKNGPYIRELRDCFLFGQTGCSVVEPFTGRVVRGAELPSAMLEEYLGILNARSRKVIYWSSFTSTKAVRDDTNAAPDTTFAGNATFKMHLAYEDWKKGQYFPASIEDYSAYPEEREVLLPPHFGFRISNAQVVGEGEAKKYIFDLEPADAPHVWDILEKGQWDEFGKWVDSHPDLVDTRGKECSLINAVAKNLSPAVETGAGPNPLATCVKYGANVNEVDPKTKETPFSNVSKKWESAPSKAKAWLDLLIGKGANPNIGSHPAPQDYEPPPAPPEEDLHWMYWVEDGIDGKDVGWYPYDDNAEKEVEQVFQEWMSSGSEGAAKIQSLKSGHFSYDIDFSSMQQKNTGSGKTRTIRRHIQSLGESLRLAGQCPNGYKWRKEEGGYRCEGGAHFVPFVKVEYTD
eukprot:TRINITY_DN17838_c0_g1_i1.p1 TRINITY_DN17838_c0_g1~~TRINITY_DN17838_c0_g1_i1.p1  ORF type:complete len:940 (+),score=133.75 TRINITY_DN17838_c0_g1_i1:95-2914(+)